METRQAMSEQLEMPKKSSFFFVLAIIALLAAVAGALYLGFQKTAIEDQKKVISADIVAIQSQIEALQEQKLEAAQIAQDWLAQVSAKEILWSRVITRIEKLIPLDIATEKPKINVLSYSGASGGGVTLSAQTTEAQQEPYEYVAELLTAFNTSPDFANAVIPSVTKGETDQGNKFLSFAMNFVFNPNGALALQSQQQTNATTGDGVVSTSPAVDSASTAVGDSASSVNPSSINATGSVATESSASAAGVPRKQ